MCIRHGVNEVFDLLECYAELIGSFRRFGTAYRSRLQGSISLDHLSQKRQVTTNHREDHVTSMRN
jgi:hypothetical protein